MATSPRSPLTFLGIAGSLRAASYNRGLIRAAIEAAPTGTRVIFYDLSDIPMFNSDVEAGGDPAAVAAFKRAIGAADALLIATPEYNHCVPGVLKNAIDWASRPPRSSVLTGKPVAKVLWRASDTFAPTSCGRRERWPTCCDHSVGHLAPNTHPLELHTGFTGGR